MIRGTGPDGWRGTGEDGTGPAAVGATVCLAAAPTDAAWHPATATATTANAAARSRRCCAVPSQRDPDRLILTSSSTMAIANALPPQRNQIWATGPHWQGVSQNMTILRCRSARTGVMHGVVLPAHALAEYVPELPWGQGVPAGQGIQVSVLETASLAWMVGGYGWEQSGRQIGAAWGSPLSTGTPRSSAEWPGI